MTSERKPSKRDRAIVAGFTIGLALCALSMALLVLGLLLLPISIGAAKVVLYSAIPAMLLMCLAILCTIVLTLYEPTRAVHPRAPRRYRRRRVVHLLR